MDSLGHAIMEETAEASLTNFERQHGAHGAACAPWRSVVRGGGAAEQKDGQAGQDR